MLVTLCGVLKLRDSGQCCSRSERPQAIVYSVRSCYVWVCLGPRLRHTLFQLPTHHNTTQHPPIQRVTTSDAAPFPALLQNCYSQCARYVLYELTALWKQGHYFIWQISSVTSTHYSGRLWAICSAGHVSAVNGTKVSGNGGHLMTNTAVQQHNTVRAISEGMCKLLSSVPLSCVTINMYSTSGNVCTAV